MALQAGFARVTPLLSAPIFAPVPSRILGGHCFGSDEVIASCTGGHFAAQRPDPG
jgi:hypothetical protein